MNLDLSHLVTLGLLILVSCCYWCDWTRFKRQKADFECKIRKLEQTNEALGDHNRYLASKNLDRHATDAEAIQHYIGKGGATHYADLHARPLANPTWQRFRARMSVFFAKFPRPGHLLTVIAA